MKKCLLLILASMAISGVAGSMHAQAVPTAYRNSRLEGGVGGMYLNNDYSDRSNKGLSLWVDYDFNRYFGLEAEAHFGGLISPDDIGENSYLVGPKLMYHRRKFTAYGKLMIGRATISNQLQKTSSGYNVTPAYGGGLDYKITRKFTVRAIDFELQKWPGFEPHTLSPLAISVGLMYTIR